MVIENTIFSKKLDEIKLLSNIYNISTLRICQKYYILCYQFSLGTIMQDIIYGQLLIYTYICNVKGDGKKVRH